MYQNIGWLGNFHMLPIIPNPLIIKLSIWTPEILIEIMEVIAVCWDMDVCVMQLCWIPWLCQYMTTDRARPRLKKQNIIDFWNRANMSHFLMIFCKIQRTNNFRMSDGSWLNLPSPFFSHWICTDLIEDIDVSWKWKNSNGQIRSLPIFVPQNTLPF